MRIVTSDTDTDIRLAMIDLLQAYVEEDSESSEEWCERRYDFLENMRDWHGALTDRQRTWFLDIAEDSGELPAKIVVGHSVYNVTYEFLERILS